MKKYIPFLIAGGIIIVLAGGWMFLKNYQTPQKPNALDQFAQCLKDKGAVFYGAFWCPHCQNQKKEFGSSVKYLPYVECSAPDGKSQTQICKDKKIDGYPTWMYADGSRESGELSLAHLAEKTGCAFPE